MLHLLVDSATRRNHPQSNKIPSKHLAISQKSTYFAPLSRNRCQEELLDMLRSNDLTIN